MSSGSPGRASPARSAAKRSSLRALRRRDRYPRHGPEAMRPTGRASRPRRTGTGPGTRASRSTTAASATHRGPARRAAPSPQRLESPGEEEAAGDHAGQQPDRRVHEAVRARVGGHRADQQRRRPDPEEQPGAGLPALGRDEEVEIRRGQRRTRSPRRPRAASSSSPSATAPEGRGAAASGPRRDGRGTRSSESTASGDDVPRSRRRPTKAPATSTALDVPPSWSSWRARSIV